MKAMLVVALIVGATFLAVAPAADARNYCTLADSWCPGPVCLYDPGSRTWDCVPPRDPIYCVMECLP